MNAIINDPKFELSDVDRNFAAFIEQDYDIPKEKIETYFINLKNYLHGLRDSGHLIGNIDYKGPRSAKEVDDLTYLIRVTVSHIDEDWEIDKFKKYNIAGLTIKHLKLDKYGCIMSKDEFDSNPTESAQDYKHYLFDRMKSRFKTKKRRQIRYQNLMEKIRGLKLDK